MPEVSRFYGIVIRMYHDEHPPPHFHASYGDHKAAVEFDPPAIAVGHLPGRALKLVMEWATLREQELHRAWRQAEAMEPIDPIPPLD